MAAGALLIWILVLGLALYAGRAGPAGDRAKAASNLLLWGGAVVPTVVLSILLARGLWLMPELRAAGTGLKINVAGEQFWWRIRYLPAEGEPVESANEIRLPADQQVELTLESPDVIHSFWIPPLGGKVDMIPGRTTRLMLEPTRPGIYRGACAEFCGTAHALMAFAVIVMEPQAFDAWIQREAAEPPSTQARGGELFLAHGCGACHRVRGTEAVGVIGPDLTHLGSRQTIGAGILENTPGNLEQFITGTEQIKPGSRMPSFTMLPREDVTAIAVYLRSLE